LIADFIVLSPNIEPQTSERTELAPCFDRGSGVHCQCLLTRGRIVDNDSPVVQFSARGAFFVPTALHGHRGSVRKHLIA
jgi:hypothetical protein